MVELVALSQETRCGLFHCGARSFCCACPVRLTPVQGPLNGEDLVDGLHDLLEMRHHGYEPPARRSALESSDCIVERAVVEARKTLVEPQGFNPPRSAAQNL